MAKSIDPAELAIANAVFASVADEMGVTLGRTAHSPNIKERRDYSCAVFDPQGRLIAQAAHIPVHLGAMPTAVQAAIGAAHPEEPFRARGASAKRRLEGFKPGDIIILNDPYLGGTHLPDITMVSPVFLATAARHSPLTTRPSAPIAFVASRAHHADVGGISPGSMPIAEELTQEGVVIPPVRLYDRGRLNKPLLDLLLRNMRAPEERRADLDAQIAANRTGEARLREIVARYGLRRNNQLTRALMDYAERMTRAAISAIPDGAYSFADFLDDDGSDSLLPSPAHGRGVGGEVPPTSQSVPIRVTITIAGDTLHADFTGSAPERPTSINAVAAVTRSAVYYVVRCLLDESVPSNDGCFRPVTLTLPARSVVNAGPPRAVAAGNVETSQRITDVVLGALARALPNLIPAASQGTMNNITIGGTSVILRNEESGAGVPALRAGTASRSAHPEVSKGERQIDTAMQAAPLPSPTAKGAGGEGPPSSSFPLPSSSTPRPAHPEVSKGERRDDAPVSQFAYYETIAGGAGASPTTPGLDAVHTHMTNTLNTPVEALEMAYPFRITEYSVRRGSGGPGRHPGGDGVTRAYEFLAPATVTLQTERRRLAPYGLNGGSPGTPGRNTLTPATANVILRNEESGVAGPTSGTGTTPRPARPEVSKDEAEEQPPDSLLPASTFLLPSKIRLTVAPGDRLTIETPGGGGWGRPRRR